MDLMLTSSLRRRSRGKTKEDTADTEGIESYSLQIDNNRVLQDLNDYR